MAKIIIHTDGGARGNPGPAAIGIVIDYSGERKEYAETIGETTNNVAEYQAVIFALKKAKTLIGKEAAAEVEIEVRSDSELIVNQCNGKYKVKEESLKNLFIEIWNLRQDFGVVKFGVIPREKNKTADGLVNKALNHINSKLL